MILSDYKGRPVTKMPLEQIAVPVLVVHHEKDACKLCPYSEIPRLLEHKINFSAKKRIVEF